MSNKNNDVYIEDMVEAFEIASIREDYASMKLMYEQAYEDGFYDLGAELENRYIDETTWEVVSPANNDGGEINDETIAINRYRKNEEDEYDEETN